MTFQEPSNYAQFQENLQEIREYSPLLYMQPLIKEIWFFDNDKICPQRTTQTQTDRTWFEDAFKTFDFNNISTCNVYYFSYNTKKSSNKHKAYTVKYHNPIEIVKTPYSPYYCIYATFSQQILHRRQHSRGRESLQHIINTALKSSTEFPTNIYHCLHQRWNVT